MAMGPAKGQGATRQVEIACLDELVPADDLHRRIDGVVDWRFVREAAASYYADALGRPSVDPIVLIKLILAGLRTAALRVPDGPRESTPARL